MSGSGHSDNISSRVTGDSGSGGIIISYPTSGYLCFMSHFNRVVDLEHLTIDDRLKGEYNMALIEKTEHVDNFVCNSD